MKEHSARLTVTTKGQVTFRRLLLDHLGAKPGDKLVVDMLPGGRLEVRASAKGSLEDFFGYLRRPGGPALTIDEMNDVIADGWAGQR